MAGARLAGSGADDALRLHARRLLRGGGMRHRHPHHRRPVAVAAGGHLDLLHLRHLHRRRGGDAAQRPPVPRRRRRVLHRPAAAGHRIGDPAGGDRGRPVPRLVRLHQLPARLLELPHAVDDADRLALCRDPDQRRPDRPVRLRAARQRMAQRLRERAGRRRAARHQGDAAMSATLVLGLMTFLFLFFGYLGVPVAFSLTAGVMIGAAFTDVTFAAIVQKMFGGGDSAALLAIPFFLLVGELMSSANVVQRVINLSLTMVGHLKGGLSQVVAVFSMFFSEMSGSTTADAAVMSRTLGVSMRKEGYDPPFIAAIIAAASTSAALVPPGVTALCDGAVATVPIAVLFMAVFLPGFMIGFGLMIYCYFFGPEGIRRPRATFRQFTDDTTHGALRV